MKILVTCPPMIGMQNEFMPGLAERGIEVHCPEVVQTLSEKELVDIIADFDGWIIGDDPVTEKVLAKGKSGKLRAAIKWGIGTDNIDFQASTRLGIPIDNTPGMFSEEVADLAMAYVTSLARDIVTIDRGVRAGNWPKLQGISLSGKTLGLVGYGNIGQAAAKRFAVAGLDILAFVLDEPSHCSDRVRFRQWPDQIGLCDFLVFACPLTPENYHMLNETTIKLAKPGVRIVNVARGSLIDENALSHALSSGHVHSAALDVFECEPLPVASELREHPRCVFGSHNASNTKDAVARTNDVAIEKLLNLLGVKET